MAFTDRCRFHDLDVVCATQRAEHQGKTCLCWLEIDSGPIRRRLRIDAVGQVVPDIADRFFRLEKAQDTHRLSVNCGHQVAQGDLRIIVV